MDNLKQIQAILYSTEVRAPRTASKTVGADPTRAQEGFEAPENAGDLVDEEETF